MLRVATIALGLVVLAAGRPIHVDQTVIVTCGDQSLVLRHINDVDVGAIGACWVDTFDEPAELNGMRSPLSGGCCGGTTRLVGFRMWIEEEQFVGSTGRTDPVSI